MTTHPHDSAAKPVTELKPCPACGGKLMQQYYDAFSCDSSFSYIGCGSCDLAFVDTHWGDEGFVEHCNRRASPDGIGAGTVKVTCELCGQPMPEGEEMFRYHGHSGPCPKQPMKLHFTDDDIRRVISDPSYEEPDEFTPVPLDALSPAPGNGEAAEAVAWRYRFEPDLAWHTVEYLDQLPKRADWPSVEYQALFTADEPGLWQFWNDKARSLASRVEAAEARVAVLTDAVQGSFCVLFLDGRNEHGSHVIPAYPRSIDLEWEDVSDQAEAILVEAEKLGFTVGDCVWAEFNKVEPQTGECGQVELDGCWGFRRVDVEMTRAAPPAFDLREENERLKKAATGLSRVLLPIHMQLAQRDLIEDPITDDVTLFSFMGSGASDRVTVGEYRKAMAALDVALGGLQKEGK